jgi:hypothetical protein
VIDGEGPGSPLGAGAGTSSASLTLRRSMTTYFGPSLAFARSPIMA